MKGGAGGNSGMSKLAYCGMAGTAYGVPQTGKYGTANICCWASSGTNEVRLLAFFFCRTSSVDDRVVLADPMDSGREKKPLALGEPPLLLGGLELAGDEY